MHVAVKAVETGGAVQGQQGNPMLDAVFNMLVSHEH
jgi:hypothetical protein